ncbi:MAG: MBOAT family O-acyltransferase [Flavobacteriales bacterium]
MQDRFKNAFLLLASIVFYSWGAPKFIFVILATTTLDFYLVRMMDDAQSEKRRKLFFILSLCLNTGLLFYFKYCNFFVENVNHVLSFIGAGQIEWVKIVLPIGISFYTFESITYVVDVYRKEHKPLSDFFQYQMYILFFPKLIAGPIVRFSEIADQITGRFATYNSDMLLEGFCRFAIGLAKKVLIANVMARMATAAFAAPIESMDAVDCWIGALAYTFQIYFDFSGYSDMAIGLAKMLGFRLPENFNNPYVATSITDFWRRWHITLGSWMRNYLYIPLGGNRVSSKTRLYFNLWLVFVLSGFWHGASWTFIAWGLFHGFWLVMDRVFLLEVLEKNKVVAHIFTFILVVIGWVLFKSDSLSQASAYIQQMFDFGDEMSVDPEFKPLFFFTLSFFFSFFVLLPYGLRVQDFVYYRSKGVLASYAMVFIGMALFVLSVAAITSSDFNPFIYFRF